MREGGIQTEYDFFNNLESGGAAVDFTGFRIDPRRFLSEDA